MRLNYFIKFIVGLRTFSLPCCLCNLSILNLHEKRSDNLSMFQWSSWLLWQIYRLAVFCIGHIELKLWQRVGSCLLSDDIIFLLPYKVSLRFTLVSNGWFKLRNQFVLKALLIGGSWVVGWINSSHI